MEEFAETYSFQCSSNPHSTDDTNTKNTMIIRLLLLKRDMWWRKKKEPEQTDLEIDKNLDITFQIP